MARRDEVTRKGAIERLQQIADEPDFVVVQTRLLVHDRSEHGRACWCCGGTTCQIVEDIPDLEVLIDTVGGQRYLRHEMFRTGPRSLP